MDGRSIRWAMGKVFRGGRALLRLIDTKEGRSATELVREDMIDAVFWGSKPTLRLR